MGEPKDSESEPREDRESMRGRDSGDSGEVMGGATVPSRWPGSTGCGSFRNCFCSSRRRIQVTLIAGTGAVGGDVDAAGVAAAAAAATAAAAEAAAEMARGAGSAPKAGERARLSAGVGPADEADCGC